MDVASYGEIMQHRYLLLGSAEPEVPGSNPGGPAIFHRLVFGVMHSGSNVVMKSLVHLAGSTNPLFTSLTWMANPFIFLAASLISIVASRVNHSGGLTLFLFSDFILNICCLFPPLQLPRAIVYLQLEIVMNSHVSPMQFV